MMCSAFAARSVVGGGGGALGLTTTRRATIDINSRRRSISSIFHRQQPFSTESIKTLESLLAASQQQHHTYDEIVADVDATTTSSSSSSNIHDTALSMLGTLLDVRRFDTLVHAGPMDYRNVVVEIPNTDLDWNTTIFYTVTDPALTAKLRQRFGQRPLWPDSVIHKASLQAQKLPPQQFKVSPKILKFMLENCVFKNEHADGGFMDHLDFCAEYTCRYFPQGSPNVLFLHSICGVNTNLFPMEFTKIPQMQELLTPHEYLHVQAFPGMLRLLFRNLLDVLWEEPPPSNGGRHPQSLTISTFHGTKVTLEGEELFYHLNYQLIHQIDFNPIQHFDTLATSDGFTRLFFRLHEYLRTRNKLYAKVDLTRMVKAVPTMTAPGQQLPTWDHFVSQVDNIQDVEMSHEQLGKQMQRYSDAINHDLSFDIQWK